MLSFSTRTHNNANNEEGQTKYSHSQKDQYFAFPPSPQGIEQRAFLLLLLSFFLVFDVFSPFYPGFITKLPVQKG
jgi:hypothetical protein